MKIGREHMYALMKPRGVIVIGATDRANSVGFGIMKNILSGEWCASCHGEDDRGQHGIGTSPNWPKLPYKFFPVNPKRQEIFGFKCYKCPEDIEASAPADMAVICVPAKSCPEAIESCGRLGTVRAAVVIAAGFKEIGEEGLRLEQKCIEIAEKYNIGVTGPNCLGIQSPNYRLNASFAATNAKPGHIAFISQSGAICTAILDWSLGCQSKTLSIGFSAFVSLGSMAHVEWADWIEYCGEDSETDAIVMYMETVGNATEFLKAAQKVAPRKPIVVIKAGKSEEASAAAASHTGSLTGAYGNFLAAMDRAGCLVLDTIDDLQNIIDLLSSVSSRERAISQMSDGRVNCEISDEIIIVTNAGGPGVLCADAVSEAKLKLCNPLPKSMLAALNDSLPLAWSHNNPIDILGDADEHCYYNSIQCITASLPSGPKPTLLIILTPQSVTRPLETAETISKIVTNQEADAPFIVCSWMGGAAVEPGREILRRVNIPVFDQPDVAARTLGLFCKQKKLAKSIAPLTTIARNLAAHELLKELRSKGTTLSSASTTITLSEHDSKSILKLYGIRTTGSVVCQSANDLKKAVETIGGYPVVMKVHGGKFSHKSDIGGVILNLNSITESNAAFESIKTNYTNLDPNGFEGVTIQPMISNNAARPSLSKHEASPELIIGCVYDPQFGPMIMFGTGGTYVEIFGDTAVTLCPIDNKDQAAEVVKRTAISKAILNDAKTQRFANVDPNDLYNTMIQFSKLCADLKNDLLECEMNPLVIMKDGKLLALDARMIISK